MIDTIPPSGTITDAAPGTVVRTPPAVRWATWLAATGTVAAIISNVFELRKAFAAGGGLGAASDLALTLAFLFLFLYFIDMMRRGRQWGRVILTVFAALGLMFNTLGLLQLGGRPITGGTQVLLAHLGNVTSILGIVCLFLPSTNLFFRLVREDRRQVAQGTRKLMLALHIGISVGWLGLIIGMEAMAIAAVFSDSPGFQRSVYSMMSLLDAIFLGMTSMFAFLTGLIGAIGTKWHLMRRRWVSTKFLTTIGVMILGFSVNHPLIAKAAALTDSGATPDEVRRVGVPLVVATGVAILALVFMTAVSTYKPWGLTKYGQRRQAAAARPRSNLGIQHELTPRRARRLS